MDYSTNEGRFFDDLRAFMSAIPGFAEQEKRKDFERVVSEYGGPKMPKVDPLLTLPPSEARILISVQRAAAPGLAEHPFFKSVALISRIRWSDDMQEIIDAETYLVQTELGVRPEAKPRPYVLALLMAARNQAKGRVPGGVVQSFVAPAPTSSVVVVEHGTSHLSSVIDAFKRNW